MKLCYKISLLKLTNKALILPLLRSWGGSKMQFCEFANNARRYLKMYQAWHCLSARAELLVTNLINPAIILQEQQWLCGLEDSPDSICTKTHLSH